MTTESRDLATQELVDARDRFLAFVRSKVDDPELAEDILQDSLLKAVRGAPALHDGDRLVSWFYAVLRNAIIDAYRRRGREPRQVDVALVEDVADDADEAAAICECFRTILPTLKPEYAQLIEQLDLKGATADSVGESGGITLNNLKVRHYRARQALRRRLEETCRVCAEHHCLDCTCKAE